MAKTIKGPFVALFLEVYITSLRALIGIIEVMNHFLHVRPFVPFSITDKQRNSDQLGRFHDLLVKAERWDMGTEVPYLATTGLFNPRDQYSSMLEIQKNFPVEPQNKKSEELRKKLKQIEEGLYPLINLIFSFIERVTFLFQ